MDYSEKFCLLIASRRFSSFKEFQASLNYISNSFGYRFNNSKFSYYDKDTYQRDKFVYKYLDLKCVHQRTHGCLAFCKVRCRKNYIYIRDWQIEHNHPPDPPDNSTVVDFSDTFNNIFTCLAFDTFEEFEAKVRELENVTGARFTKYSSRFLPNEHPLKETLIYERVNYSCVHSGSSKQRTESPLVSAKSKKIGCPARIRACVGLDKMKIMLCNMRHNHIVSNIYPGLSRTAANKKSKSIIDLPINKVKEEEEELEQVIEAADYALQLPKSLLVNGFPFLPIVFKKTLSEENAIRRNLKEESNDVDESDYDSYSDASTFGMYDDDNVEKPTSKNPRSDFLPNQACTDRRRSSSNFHYPHQRKRTSSSLHFTNSPPHSKYKRTKNAF